MFCATKTPQQMRAANGQYRQWKRGHVVTWGVAASPSGVAIADFRDVCRTAFGLWEAVSGLKTEYRTNPNAVNVRVDVERIDGAGKVLAQAELPGFGQNSGTLGCWLDSGERAWVLSVNPSWDVGEVDMLRVLCHEFGHNLGLDHAPQDGSPADLMDPRVSAIRKPQSDWDVPQIQFRYGKPVDVTPDNPTDGETWFDAIVALLKSCTMSEADKRLVADVLKTWKGQ